MIQVLKTESFFIQVKFTYLVSFLITLDFIFKVFYADIFIIFCAIIIYQTIEIKLQQQQCSSLEKYSFYVCDIFMQQ